MGLVTSATVWCEGCGCDTGKRERRCRRGDAQWAPDCGCATVVVDVRGAGNKSRDITRRVYERSHTLQELKDEYAADEGLPPDQQRVFLDCRALTPKDDASALWSLGARYGSVFVVYLRQQCFDSKTTYSRDAKID